MQVNSNQTFVDPSIHNDFYMDLTDLNTFNFENSYNVPINYNDFGIKFPLKIAGYHEYEDIATNISTYGTIKPAGPYMDTPEGIKVELKPHQKRTLYEMYQREHLTKRIIKDNVLLLCDNVGSGKSLCVLSLISKSPLVENLPNNIYFIPDNIPSYQKQSFNIPGTKLADNILQLKSNLLVVPHGIYNQWKSYIEDQTSLTAYYIGLAKDINALGNNKEDIFAKLDSYNVILVKATMYQGFYYHLLSNGCEQKTEIDYNHTNQIADPRKIVNQIRTYFDTLHDAYTKENKFEQIDTFITQITELRKEINLESMSQTKNYGLCSENNVISGFIFQRVIFDEADSIKIPNCPKIYGKYTWFVTSSINNLLYPKGKKVYENYKYKTISNGIVGSGFIKDTMKQLTDEGNRYNRMRIFPAIVRSNYDFIQDSILIPDPIVEYIKCLTPPELLAIASAIHPDALSALNAGDTATAIKLLGCETNTEDDLIKMVNKALYKKQEELKAHLADKELAILLNNEAQDKIKFNLENNNTTHTDYAKWKEDLPKLKSLASSYKQSVQNFTEQLKNVETKIAGIEERIKGVKDKQCPICASNVENPCMTNCCKNIFCLQCLSTAIQYSHKKECPLCRSTVDMNKIHIIIDASGNQVSEETGEELPNKLDTLTKHILSNPNKRFLVFSAYENTFEIIQNEFTKLGIKYSKIAGTAARINNIITKYKNNEYQALLLNANHFGAGLNLQITDEILIYHRMSKDLERQVIGRAQRLGRSDPLKINYLCYENEYPTGSA